MKWLPTYESRKRTPHVPFQSFRSSDYRLRTSDWLLYWDLRFQTTDVELRTSEFRLLTLSFGLQTSDFTLEVLGSLMSDVQCQMSNVQCPMSKVQCLKSDIRYPISDIRYPISDIRGLMSDVRCPMPDRVMTYHIRTYFLLNYFCKPLIAFLCPWNWKKNWKKEKGLDSRLARACLVARCWLGLEVGSWNDRPNSVKLNRHDNVFVAFSFHQLGSSRLQFPRKNPYRG